MSENMSNPNARKYDAIEHDIRNKIETGVYTDKIPGVRALAEEYNANPITVSKALTRLVKAGVLYRRRGAGTFVGSGGSRTKQKLVALFIRPSGHMYENMAGVMLRNLQANGFVPLVIDIGAGDFLENPEDKLREVLDLDPAALIINGCSEFPYHELWECREKIHKLIFVLQTESSYNFNCISILSDSWWRGYQSAKYLLELGHEKQMLVVNYLDIPADTYRYTGHYEKVQGFRYAFEERGILDNCRVFYYTSEQEKSLKKIREIMQGKNAPTGIVSASDYWAVLICNELKNAGLHAPDDFSILGGFNTPWADMNQPKLSSVSLKEEEIARIAIQKILDEDSNDFEKIVIKSELVERSSCRSIK
jgi:DNA-binding LacI/PurR family transcriptional regulator